MNIIFTRIWENDPGYNTYMETRSEDDRIKAIFSGLSQRKYWSSKYIADESYQLSISSAGSYSAKDFEKLYDLYKKQSRLTDFWTKVDLYSNYHYVLFDELPPRLPMHNPVFYKVWRGTRILKFNAYRPTPDPNRSPPIPPQPHPCSMYLFKNNAGEYKLCTDHEDIFPCIVDYQNPDWWPSSCRLNNLTDCNTNGHVKIYWYIDGIVVYLNPFNTSNNDGSTSLFSLTLRNIQGYAHHAPVIFGPEFGIYWNKTSRI